MTNLLNLTVVLEQDQDLTPNEVDVLTRSLLSEIEQDIDVDSADLMVEEAPPGARAAGAVTIGTIVLALLPVVVGKLADLLIDWIRRNQEFEIAIVMPVGESEITVKYNSARMKPDRFKQEIAEAVAAAKTYSEG